MRILVTGGGGYVGTVTVPMLLAQGHRVRLFDTFLSGMEPLRGFSGHRRLEVIRGDVRDGTAVRSVMRGQDAVVHLASMVGYPACDADPQAAVTTNVDGTRRIVEALDSRLLVFSSTCSVYGRVTDLCTENTLPRPLTLYGNTKKQAEKIVSDAGGVVLRFATLFGPSPRLRVDLLIHHFIREALRTGRLVIYQSHFRRSFLHVADASRCLSMALTRYSQMAGQAFNVCDERATLTKLELARRIRNTVVFDLREERAGADSDQRDYEVSCARIRSLGFHPRLKLDDGIDALVKLFRALEAEAGGCLSMTHSAN